MSGVKHSIGAFRRNKSSGISKGQVQLIALFLVLALVPTTLIVAQNATNSTTAEGMVTDANLTIPVVLNENVNESLPDAPQDDNQTVPEINTTLPEENVTIPEENVTITEENQTADENVTVSEDNVTISGNTTVIEDNTTLPEENVTTPEENVTIPEENVTIPDDVNPEENVTLPEENATSEDANETVEVSEYPPSLSIEMDIPERLTRGGAETVLLSAIVLNSGSEANGVIVEWILPEGFSVVSGDIIKDIGTLPENASFRSRITVSAGVITPRGVNEIRVKASYD